MHTRVKDAQRCNDVAAVIVTYNPELTTYFRGLDAIARQVGLVIVVDNASGGIPVGRIEGVARDSGIEAKVIVLPRNEGLGTAINVGIGEARSGGYPHIILFDQDSVPEVGMVARLKQAYKDLSEKDESIAAVGPQFRDPENGHLSGFVDIINGRFRLVRCDDSERFVQVGMMISSGSFIPMCAINAVGDMDETLFIDYVDTEWCLRARSKGWMAYGTCGAIMEHSLGEHRRRVWLLRWHNIPCHAPFRYYYILRNILILSRRDYIYSEARKALYVYAIKLVVCLLFLLPNRFKNMIMALRGIIDGIRRNSGPMSQN